MQKTPNPHPAPGSLPDPQQYAGKVDIEGGPVPIGRWVSAGHPLEPKPARGPFDGKSAGNPNLRKNKTK